MITFTHKGNFNKIEDFFKKSVNKNYIRILEKYGREGVLVLASATPIDSGETAKCWNYKITNQPGRIRLTWTNSNIVDDVPIAIIIQYGHGTGNGGYIQGRDYINPAIRPIFDIITNDIWREVTT